MEDLRAKIAIEDKAQPNAGAERSSLSLREKAGVGRRHLPFAICPALIAIFCLTACTIRAQTIQFLNAAPSVYENGTNVSIVVTRTPATGVASVEYTTLDGTAVSGSDYQLTSGSLTFNNGESFQIITVPIINDFVPEGTETFIVTLSNPSGATLGLSTNTVTIFDDDTILRLGNNTYNVDEDATNLVVEVLRNGGTAGTVSVDYFTQSPQGTNLALIATPNADYTATFGTLLFLDGQITNYITIPINDDCFVESNEVFQVVLTNAIGATIGNPGLADATIIDNDTGAGTLAFSVVTPQGTNVSENVGAITVHVSRLCGTTGAISVRYRDAFPFAGICPGTDSTLTNQDHSISTNNVLNWADGDATDKTFDINIVNDDFLELDETLVLELFQPTGGARIRPSGSRIPITILFDDQPPGAADRTHNVQSPVNPTPGANNTVYASAVYTDTNDLANFNKSLIGGDFSAVNAIVRNGIARLNPNGSVDTSFNPGSGADGFVNSIVIQPLAQGSSRILVGGGFTSINNVSRNGIARLNANGTLDTTFNPGAGADGPVLAVALQPDGKVIIGGEFTTVNNLPRNRIARLNANGSVDSTFNPLGGADDTVYTVAVQPNGRILLGGVFLNVNGTSQSAIARLNSDGSIDPTFNPVSGADSAIFTMDLQSDGRIVVGGAFSTYDGVSRTSVARLNTDGTLDTTFGPCSGAIGPVYSVQIQNNGGILISGQFTSYNGTPRNNIARLYPDGTVDTGFLDSYYNQAQPGTDMFVSTISIQNDGNIIIGGGFAAIGGGLTASAVLTRYNVARLIGGDPQPAFNLPGNVQFLSATYNVDEFAGLLTVTVVRSNGILGTVAVDYATGDDTAVAGTHYGSVSGSLVWGDCDSIPRTFSVPITDNNIVDGNHTFKLFLSNPHSIGTNPVAQPALGLLCAATVTIVDEDVNHGVLGFSTPIYNINENGGSATITVTRTNGSTDSVQVQFATSNGSAASPSDYTATNGTLRFLSGETSKSFTVKINDDLAKEPEETINLRLFGATGGATLGRTNATLLIFDNDNGEGSVSFAAQNFTVIEGTGVNTTNYATVTVRRTSGSSGTVAVDAYTVELPLGPGIAREGIDYLPVTNHLVFGPGVTNLTFTIPILSDHLVEGDELIGLALTNVFNGTIGFVSSATCTIADDDFYGSLSFSDPAYYFSERATNALITVVRLGGNAEQVSVDYFTTPGTATDGADFMGVSNTLVFPDGVTVGTITIPIYDDTALEFNETVFLTLTNFAKASPGSITNATLVINDDEELNVPAGSVDTLFNPNPGADGFVNAVVVQTNGNIIIGGAFTSITGVSRNRIARLLPDGSLDASFNPRGAANAAVHALALQPDQKIILAGDFTTIASTNRNYVARLNQNGGVDTTFNPGAGADNPIYAVALQSNGKILIGGNFSSFNGVPRNGIARLNANGSLDTSFHPAPGVNGTVRAIAIQNDGKILIGGNFILVNGENSPGVARLNADGSFDSSFFVGDGADGEVRSMALQSDGAVLVGGVFNVFDGNIRNYLTRLNSDGSTDFSFDPGTSTDNSVSAITVQSDGKILVVGEFTLYDGITARRIARLNPNGSIDPTINFGTGANAAINAIALQNNEEMVIGGAFTSFNELQRQYVARLVGGINLGAGTLQFSSQSYTIHEDETNAIITVLRIGGLAGQVTVAYATSNGNADAGLDYTNVSGTLVFREGETRGSFLIPIVNDTAVELDETVNLTLSDPTDGAELGAPPTAVLTIISDDCILGFSSSAYSVNENVVSSNAVINVVRTGGTVGTVFVDYATAPGSATPGVDYQTNRGTIAFLPGETNKTFTIGIINDTLQEGNEDFRVVLSRPRGSAILGLATATVTIVDDDFSPGIFAFATNSYRVLETGTNVVITVMRTNGSLGVVTLNYSTGGGTATPGADYFPQSGTLTFGQGVTNQTIVVPIFDDAIAEGDENFFVIISNPGGGASIRGPTAVIVTITDNEFRPGSLDMDFDPGDGPNNFVRSLAVQGDGRVVIGGAFTFCSTNSRQYFARLETNGLLDFTFNPGSGASALVSSVGILPDNRVVLGGGFTTVNGMPFSRVARLNTNGSADLNFSQGGTTFDSSVNVIAIDSHSRVVAGGGFSLPAHGIIRLRLDGSVDPSFNAGAGANGPVHAVALQNNGQVLFGGAFTLVNGSYSTRVARLNSDGTLDEDFDVTVITNGAVYSLVVQPDGKVIAGGDFYIIGRSNRVGLVRLNPDGTYDPTFRVGSGANGPVYAMGFQSQGKLVIGGNFTFINNTNRNRIARLNDDGSLDLSFNPGTGANATVYTLAVLPNDNIVIGGDFTIVDGFPRNRVARILANDASLRILGIALPAPDRVDVTINSLAGSTYVLQSSQYLTNWQDVTTNSAVGKTLILTDPNAGTSNQNGSRMYRVRLGP